MQQEEILHWLLTHYGQELMRPGLERMREALQDLLPRFKNTKIITIAGTNGKGETTLRLSDLLKDERHYVWTSPHIERLSERFRSEEGEIDPGHLWKLIQACHEKVRSHKFELSFYEFLFLVFCTWAQENPPEFLLLEVGLGGRLDAVNVFDADLVLIPSISRDHQEILGRRYDEILREKLGVLRAGAKLMSFFTSQYLRERAESYAQKLGAGYIDLTSLTDKGENDFSLRNYLLASAAFSHLKGLPFEARSPDSPLTRLAHRGELVQGQNTWQFFGSHNVDGMRKLIQFLHSDNYTFGRPSFDSVIVSFSKRNEKDLRVMLKMLKRAGLGEIIVTIFPHPKAASMQVMKALSEEEGLDFVQDISFKVQGWNNRQVLVTGSYYFIGHFKSFHCR